MRQILESVRDFIISNPERTEVYTTDEVWYPSNTPDEQCVTPLSHKVYTKSTLQAARSVF